METVNIHYAKTHLSKLIELAAKGEPFVIAKAGKPMVQVTALVRAPEPEIKRVGSLAGHFDVPDDIDSPYEDEIVRLFEGR